MLQHSKLFDKLSSYVFTAAFAFRQLSLIHFFLLNLIFNILALVFYLIGYLLWIAAALLYPDHPNLQHKWYGFAEFKHQYLFACIIGTAATCIALLAVITPVVSAPAAWLFLASNVIWCIGEYHKLKNHPPFDEEYSHTRQMIYFRYSLLSTLASLIAALTLTSCLVFPGAAFTIFIVGTSLGTLVTLVALAHWINFNWGSHEPLKKPVKSQGDQPVLQSAEQPQTSSSYRPDPNPNHPPLFPRTEILDSRQAPDSASINPGLAG